MHLIEWDGIDLRVRGEKVAAMIGQEIERRKAPLSKLTLEFRDGELLIEGKVQKIVSVPFRLAIRRIEVVRNVVTVHLEDFSAFGLPVPMFLRRLVDPLDVQRGVRVDPEQGRVIVELERFLPPFVEADVRAIRVVSGGIALHLGPGGADPPAGEELLNG